MGRRTFGTARVPGRGRSGAGLGPDLGGLTLSGCAGALGVDAAAEVSSGRDSASSSLEFPVIESLNSRMP